ncbi:MAG: TatD family hydrolase [Lunatimonas sp.]|uniref:TatD family hydrolase n=1 Tax=Lunatimonas sp. TaxID=2060141 RepID=UPI00263BE235|nr:TatD family hydrolase [Lunatimonas sp.]MCC5936392.1 TatD family hydrolase [Lunatimonas sp.]
MKFIDTHAHIYSRKFDGDREEMILRSQQNGVKRIYMPNIDLDSLEPMLELEARFPGVCIPTIGLHPCDVNPDFETVLGQLKQLMDRRDFAGIGETGIDLYWDKTYVEEQKEALRMQIAWAKNKGWPIILHCRNSIAETIEVIRDAYDSSLFGIFHCFSGSVEQAGLIREMGFYLGIGGTVTYKNSGVADVVKQIGLEAVVLETDAPYLAPVPFRGKRNSPEHIPVIANHLAGVLGCGLAEVAEQTTHNALSVFNHLDDEL